MTLEFQGKWQVGNGQCVIIFLTFYGDNNSFRKEGPRDMNDLLAMVLIVQV